MTISRQHYTLIKIIGTAVMSIFVLLAILLVVIPKVKANACAGAYAGAQKYVLWGSNEWHHVVDVYVGDNNGYWKIIAAPLPTTVKGRIDGSYIRLSYRWPANWWDPYPVNWWCIQKAGG